jgi:hypothetical protein
MKLAVRRRSESAFEDLARTYEMIRDLIADRLEDMDAAALRDRATTTSRRMSKQLRTRVERRVRPRPQRRPPLSLTAVMVMGAAAGLGYLLYDRRRRDMLRGRLTQVQVRARERMSGMGVSGAVDSVMARVRPSGGVTELESSLQAQVDEAVAGGGLTPMGLEAKVEGRTVYFRGAIQDPAAVDQAMERVQQIPGVVAVVNLTTHPEPTVTP